MRWELDFNSGSLYVGLTERPIDHQEETADGVVVDLDADGRVVGLEVLAAWAPFDWHSIVRDFDVDETDAESLEFLTAALVSMLSKPRLQPSAPPQPDPPSTGSSVPARVVSAA